MQTSLRALCAIALAGSAACSPAGTTEKPAEPAAAAPAAAAPGPIAFSINVTISKTAIDKMAKDGDQVRVSATYYGTAKSSGAGTADLARIPLGDEEETSAP